ESHTRLVQDRVDLDRRAGPGIVQALRRPGACRRHVVAAPAAGPRATARATAPAAPAIDPAAPGAAAGVLATAPPLATGAARVEGSGPTVRGRFGLAAPGGCGAPAGTGRRRRPSPPARARA